MSEPESKSHWRSLAEQIGAEVPETPPAAPPAASPNATGAPPPAAKKSPPPRPAEPKRERSHWAGLAGMLGIEFPEPPPPLPAPPPEPEAVKPPRAVEMRAPDDSQRDSYYSDRGAPSAHYEDAGDVNEERDDDAHQGTVFAVPPAGLVEDMPAAVSEMLDEVRDVDVFDSGREDERGASVSEVHDHRDADKDEDDDENASTERSPTSADSDSERPRRGRRRRGRRRRRGEGEDESPKREGPPLRNELARTDDDFDDDDDDVDDDLQDDGDDEGDENEPSRSSEGRRGRTDRGDKPRKFPTWNEAMDILVTRNQDSRKTSGPPRHGGRPSGRGRGRGRRPAN